MAENLEFFILPSGSRRPAGNEIMFTAGDRKIIFRRLAPHYMRKLRRRVHAAADAAAAGRMGMEVWRSFERRYNALACRIMEITGSPDWPEPPPENFPNQ